ncbi:hypothetical protein Pogu_1414 [Pyrobaculum oguniense TE7]|uniref:Uncharacterized protein n=1 Tax=Pyrobaculum oguniense (strain DSM 13380 / JCM 10595 / TE7) TaxID=698757 RepID=H6QAG1_PYROT|nr:hypothetical protein Pogu_1414 [Pyrobaculum oguniense TE7]
MEVVEFMVRYLDSKIGRATKYRFHEDQYAYHLLAWFKDVDTPQGLKCFDEERGLLGGRKIFCYDEVDGRKLSVVLMVAKNKVKMVMVSLFKEGAPLIWPPRRA